MATAAAEAHITAEARLREIAIRAVIAAWRALPSFDEEDVAPFIAIAAPAVVAAQRASVALTAGYLAQAIGHAPRGINPDLLIGPTVRNGTPPEVLWRRPFITVWNDLSSGTKWDKAVKHGLARATSTASTDVQLSMRETLRAAGDANDLILGYRRVPDPGACEFCRLVAGQRYTTDQLLPIHSHCGCGVDVITEANRSNFFGNRENDLSITRDGVTVAVREHGELGPVLVDGTHEFTSAADF